MANVSDEVAERLLRDMDAASDRLRKGGNPKAEVAYGVAYQALVRAGLRTQLRAKYRVF